MIKFRPKLSLYELEYWIPDRFNPKELRNDAVYRLVKKLTGCACPTSRDGYDTKWDSFYLPLRRSGKRISVPLSVLKYERDFYITIPFGRQLKVSRGKAAVESVYGNIFREALRFVPAIIASGGRIVEETVPYDFRTGKIKGRHILNKLMPQKERECLMRNYEAHTRTGAKVTGITLQDYLDTAAVCYRAAYKGTKRLTPLQMYKKWADGRHGGMLDIRNPASREDFTGWMKSGRGAGSHPFEIVFSWHMHGIHLYPPDKERPHYGLMVTNYAYCDAFIQMVKALIKNKIPFQARDFADVLDFLSGEKYFTVNDYDELRFSYIPSAEYKKRYFRHVEWDKLPLAGSLRRPGKGRTLPAQDTAAHNKTPKAPFAKTRPASKRLKMKTAYRTPWHLPQTAQMRVRCRR